MCACAPHAVLLGWVGEAVTTLLFLLLPCLQDRVRMACEVASALVFLHSAPEPIIHMDLKPGG